MYKDSQGDVWDSKTIGQVFTTEANQTNHDLYHNKNKIEGIQTIANYRNKTVENIGGREVPINSWRKDIMVTDDEVIELIKSNQINGVSPNNTLQTCPVCANELKNIKGNIYYNKDIENKECMNPIFTSLVPEPANGYGMNVYTYDKFLEKTKNPNGGKLSNKVKEMLKAFGEAIVSHAEGIENEEEIEETELEEQEEEKNVETKDEVAEEETETNSDDMAELKKSVKELTEEVRELKKSDVVKETDSIDDRREEIRQAIIDKNYADEEYLDVWITLMAEDCVVIERWDENKYYKVDYTVDEKNNVTVGDLVEVELQYAEVGAETEEEESEETEESETTEPESQKSKKPKIKLPKEKDETVEMEKQKEPKVNHLGMPVMSTDEIAKAKNSFKF